MTMALRWGQPTQAEIDDPSMGCCIANRDGCVQLGPWRPFYRGYVCRVCLAADQRDVNAHHRPEWWPQT